MDVIQDIKLGVVVVMMLTISVYVVGTYNDSLSINDLNSDAQTAINNTFDNAYEGFELGSVIPLVVFAAIIIGVLMKTFA